MTASRALATWVVAAALTLANSPLAIAQAGDPARIQYVRDYTREEVKTHGLDCVGLRSSLVSFLQGLSPRLAPKSSETTFVLSPELTSQLKKYSESLFHCGRLYEIGRNGEWNGLQDLEYVQRVHRDFIRLDTIVRYTLTSKKCGKDCLHSAHADMQSAQRNMLAALSR
jgi:hypothetical protein